MYTSKLYNAYISSPLLELAMIPEFDPYVKYSKE